jgi:ubiquinone/menaquinone biosynthesis C-methylase UbiE
MAPPPPPECFAEDYDSLGRFASYWHQIEEILALRPASVLEIGTGNGLVSSYLRQRDIALTVLDIDGRVQSDVIGSVTRLPIRDAAFDVVSCCQVLEHLPYEEFAVALGEIYRVSRRYAVISLPDFARVYKFLIQLPKIGELRMLLRVPRLRPPRWEYNGEHHWSINVYGCPMSKIVSAMTAAGFQINKRFRVFEMPWHHFFVLGKSDRRW